MQEARRIFTTLQPALARARRNHGTDPNKLTYAVTRFCALVFLLLLGISLSTTSRTVRSYGYDPNDATQFLQAALNDISVDTVIIDAVPWVSGPLAYTRQCIGRMCRLHP